MQPRDLSSITDILIAAKLTQQFIEPVNQKMFESNLMRQSAVIRLSCN
jgi:uncharacterized protein with HEPN domain